MEPANTWTWTRPHSSADAVTALYEAHALGLVRLAVVMTGDQGSAEDIVQDAFLGLYRRWDSLTDLPYPLAYLRASVLNGCRTALRRRSRADRAHYLSEVPSESAEARALLSEEQRAVARAIRDLPDRQREALVSATTSTCPRPTRRRRCASAVAPSSPQRPGRLPRSDDVSRRGSHDTN